MSFKRVFPFVLVVLSACMIFTLVSCGSKAPKLVEIAKVTKAGDTPLVDIVVFPHDVHASQDIQCIQCHHKNGNDEREKKCATEGCHLNTNDYSEGMYVMHQACLDCHLSLKKGPSQCAKCHTERVVKK